MQGVPIILHNGAFNRQVGFAGYDSPTCIIPNAVSEAKQSEVKGENTQELIIAPMDKNGIIINWDEMETIWHATFAKHLKVKPEEHPVLLTEPPLNPRANREKMTEVMFENINTPAFYLSPHASLSLFAAGRTTGLVVDSGYTATYAVPIYEGYVETSTILYSDIGGRDLTKYMMKLLHERSNGDISAAMDWNIIKEMKEKVSYVAFDFDKEMESCTSSNEEQSYKLPDGELISLGNEKFRCPEPLFQPNLIGRDNIGIHEMVHNSIRMTECDIWGDLYSNIVLAGGSSIFPGIEHRLKREVIPFANHMSVNIIVPPERLFSSWIGGSILASLCTFPNCWISKETYEESGPSVVHRMC